MVAFFIQKCLDAMHYIMTKHGDKSLLNYIDDLLCFDLPSSIEPANDFLLKLLDGLGLDISTKKLHPPDTVVTCLGIQCDTVRRTMSIPNEKLQDIITICHSWSNKQVCTKTELQSLLGSLLYITKCVKLGRHFLNRMLQLLRDNVNSSHISLHADFKKDLVYCFLEAIQWGHFV